MDLIWEEPPATNSSPYDEIANELKRHPTQWAMIKEYKPDPDRKTSPANRANALANGWKQGRAMAGLREDGFEVVARKGKVYARYVPSDA